MFNWLKRKATAKITASHAAEVDDWTRKLRFLDSSSIGLIVAIAANVRNECLQVKGIDLLSPHLVIHQDPDIAATLVSHIKTFQKAGQNEAASGYFPWLFTVRACFDLDLLPNTRELWRQLERGFPHVESAAEKLEDMFGVRLNTYGATEFPQGFTPDPL